MAISFRLDKTAFAAMNFNEADKAMNDGRNYTPHERLAIANRLISIAYNFPLGSPPPMDKTYFQARNLKYGKYI